MTTNNNLVFRVPLTKEEVTAILLRYLQAENYINGNEEKYFTELQIKPRRFVFEFVVPIKNVELTNTKENAEE